MYAYLCLQLTSITCGEASRDGLQELVLTGSAARRRLLMQQARWPVITVNMPGELQAVSRSGHGRRLRLDALLFSTNNVAVIASPTAQQIVSTCMYQASLHAWIDESALYTCEASGPAWDSVRADSVRAETSMSTHV